MRIWVRSIAAAAVLLVGTLAGVAHAEVAALIDRNGDYIGTEVRPVREGRFSSVWIESRGRGRLRSGLGPQRVVLNPTGGLRGDGSPSVADHPLTGLPWAVWAFNEDGDYELALSVFDGRNWTQTVLLGVAANGIDDLEPKLVFTTDGRPIIVWWQLDQDGEQSVWFTTRTQGFWREPSRLTSTRVKASRPSLMIRDDELIVAYNTDDRGIRLQTFPLNTPMLGGSNPAGGDDGPDPPTGGDTRPPECQLIGCGG